MKQYAKKAVQEAERLGYEFDHTNSNNFHVYVHPSVGEIALNPSMNEGTARQVMRRMQQAAGALDRTQGRDAGAVKDRARRRADLDAERLAAERRQIEAQRDTYLARIAGAPLSNLDRGELARLETRLKEIRRMEALMVSIPASADHRGRGQSRHRAGAR